LTITDEKGKEHTGLCTARPLCTRWNAEVMMPDSYKGRRVRITISKGTLLTGGGDVAGTMDAFATIQFIDSESIRAQERPSDACTLCGVWKYVDNTLNGGGSKHYLRISQAGAGKFKLSEGWEYEGAINWSDDGVMIRNADGIYLKPINGRLVGRFVSGNFRATHGHEFIYKITCELKSNNKLLYSVWSSIRGETDKQEATKIGN
jgi:hypothetical protein